MSEFRSFKKADLAKVARKVGISVRAKDTKQSLLEKIDLFIEDNPDLARDLLLPEDVDVDDDEEVVTLVEETVDSNTNSESGSDSDSDSQLSSEDSVDDSESQDVAEGVGAEGFAAKSIADAELADEDDDDKDYDAPPPINLKEWIVDPAIDVFERAYAQVLVVSDKLGVTTADANEDLRETLSRTVTLNWLEASSEAAYFLYYYVPLVAVKDNKSVHQVFRDNVPWLNTVEFRLPDVTALWNYGVASIFANWLVYAVGLPLLVAYYFNFSRRVVVVEDADDEQDELSFVVRLYKYDPFIFALAKVLIFYFIFKNGALTSLDSYRGLLQALRNHVFIQLGIYHTFVVSLGNFPLVVGAANVIVGLYSQFEDF